MWKVDVIIREVLDDNFAISGSFTSQRVDGVLILVFLNALNKPGL